MPAELTHRSDGSAMLAVAEQAAWHGEGTVTVGRRIEADELAALVPEWVATVRPAPLYTTVNGQVTEVDSHVANVRAAAGQSPEAIVGVVGRRRYQLVQNMESFAIAEGIMGLTERAQVASFGLLRGGALAFLTLYLGEDYLVPGAESEKRGRYLNMVNSFDASYALTATNSDVRQVCMNTVRWNLQSAPRKVAIRHTGDMESRLADARDVLGMAERYAQLQARVAQVLVERRATPAAAEKFFASLVPLPLDKDQQPVTEGRALTNAKQLRDVLHAIWWQNPTVEPVRDTEWGLLQAVSWYTNHAQPRRKTELSTVDDNRYEALVLDDSAPLETRAQRLLTATLSKAEADKLAKGLPSRREAADMLVGA